MITSLAQTAYALIIVLALPSWAFARVLRTRGGYPAFASWAFGIPLSIGAVTLTCFWFSRVLGFAYGSVSLQIVAMVVAVYCVSLGKAQHHVTVPSPYFSHKFQIYLFTAVAALFILMVWFPFSHSGLIRERGVIIPNMGDWSLISGDISAIVATGVPPQNPFMASRELTYYYFFHLYAAVLVIASGKALGIQGAGTSAALIVAGAVFICFFALVREWLKDFASALVGTSLISFIGGFDVAPTLYLAHLRGAWPPNIDNWMHWTKFGIVSPPATFQWIPQHTLAVLYFFLILYLLSRRLTHGCDKALCALCWASLFGFSSFVALGGVFIIGFSTVLEGLAVLVKKNGRKEWRDFLRPVTAMIALAALGLALAAPIYWGALFKGKIDYTGTSVIRELRLPPVNAVEWMKDYRPPNVFIHLLWLAVIELFEFGPVAVLGIGGLMALISWENRPVKRLLLFATIAAFLWVNSVNMGGNNAGECSSKCIGIILWWLLAVWSALFFREMRRAKRRARQWFFIPVLGIGFLSSLLSLFLLSHWDYLPGDEYNAFLYVRHRIPVRALVQRGPYCGPVELIPPAWSWHLTPYANEFLTREYLVDEKTVQSMRRELDEMFRTDDPAAAHAVFRKYGANYVSVGLHERERYGPGVTAKFDRSPSLFEKVYTGGRVSLYRVT